MQPAAGGLAEVGGEKDQGAGDEQSEDCPPPADRLVVHAGWFSKACEPAGGTLLAAAAPVPRILVGAVDDLELLQRAPRSDRDARERRLGQVRGHLGLLAQALVQALQERPAA